MDEEEKEELSQGENLFFFHLESLFGHELCPMRTIEDKVQRCCILITVLREAARRGIRFRAWRKESYVLQRGGSTENVLWSQRILFLMLN